MDHEHHTPPEHQPHHPSSQKSMSFNGIDWKREIHRALAILKLDKKMMHEVANDEKATKVGTAFIVVPQLVALLLAVIFHGGFVGFIHGRYLLAIVGSFLLIYGVYFVATKWFKGKGDLMQYFRPVAYTNVLSVLVPVLVLLSIISWGLASLIGVVMLLVGIWMLIVSYYILLEAYHVTSKNAVITLVIAILATGIIIGIVQNVLFPNPFEELANEWGRAINRLK